MVEIARGGNGKFLPKSTDATKSAIGINSADVGSANQQDIGSGERVVDPTAITAAAREGNGSGTDSGKRGRGRPAGSGKSNEKEGKAQEKLAVNPGQIDLNSLNFTIFFAHSTLAQVLKAPELAFTEQESSNMATACLNVMKHYNIKASQKAIDWGNLLLTGGMIYGAKFHAISERKKQVNAMVKAAKAEARAPFGLP